MSGCSFNSSAIVVERSCSYFLFPSIRRAYARAWVSNSTPALIRGVITSAAMSGLNSFAILLSRTIGARPFQRPRFHVPPLQLVPRFARPVLGAGHENLAAPLARACQQRKKTGAAFGVELSHHVVNKQYRRRSVNAGQILGLGHFQRDGERAFLAFAAELRDGAIVQQQLQIVAVGPDECRAKGPFTPVRLREFHGEVPLHARLIIEQQFLGVEREAA